MESPTLSAEKIEVVFNELIVHQRARVLTHARRLNASLTEDDITQPHDFPELAHDADWNYEDGILAGYVAAQMALRVEASKAESRPTQG